MTVQAPFLVSAVVVAAALGVVRHNSGSVSSDVALAAFQQKLRTPSARAVSGSGAVESAMHQLDLSKLTMADFGDAEPSR